ncbi:MAG: AI-2E family transporter [Coriobacteriia bacterium]|nr:AI-2E family transporter [Coriobacteriia bacterium]
MITPEQRYSKWRTTAVIAWGSIGILVLIGAALVGMSHIVNALVPFALALLFAFLMRSPINALVSRGWSRGLAALTCILTVFIVIGGVLTFVIPPIGRQTVAFVGDIPKYLTQVENLIASLSARFTLATLPTWVSDISTAISDQMSGVALAAGNGIAKGVVSAGSTMATGVFDIFIGFVIAYWILRDLPKIRQELAVLAGPKYERDLEHALATISRVVGGYLKGQTIASLVTGTLATIGLAILGVPYALVLGLMVFILNYVPYIGPMISALVAGLVGLLVGPWVGVGAVAVVVVAQNVTDNFVTPRVMSEQVDLHPTLVIFSLLVGGALFGIPGMVLAIPVAATAKGLFVYYYERKTERSLVSDDGALFRRQAGPAPEEPRVVQDDESAAETPDDIQESARNDT